VIEEVFVSGFGGSEAFGGKILSVLVWFLGYKVSRSVVTPKWDR
jgi:hypothetical protein